MGQSTIQDIVIPILIVVAIITGGFSFIAMNHPKLTSDDSSLQDYNATYAKFAQLSGETDQVSSTLQASKPESGTWGLLTGLINTGYQSIQMLWTSLTTFTTIINDANYLPVPIPAWFTALIVSLLLISFVLALIALWFKVS